MIEVDFSKSPVSFDQGSSLNSVPRSNEKKTTILGRVKAARILEKFSQNGFKVTMTLVHLKM